ncbi:pyrroline-5-carboxylate reductase [Halochromatium glycolicum]|uniref:Pyrroline-5-carboxylate reductase n=1 Tax=Halochromatium glycolicum TaxID=85075 RepID=A0AAJ0U6R4_9GAMM|nr:pyrroline-5-carboxylate reductase [Halochromatium glycolicum]MBK1706213.1 pyrroline-5-carboxylate reductase [Halochromatium glycolicum]
MTQTRIAFIGGGNMARSLIAGLIADDYDPAGLRVCDPDHEKREQLASNFGVPVSEQAAEAVTDAEVIVLCVKPQVAADACRELAALLHTPHPLLISVMAGVREATIMGWLGGSVPLVRAMPNTPVLVQSGAIGLHAGADTNAEQRNLAEEVLRAGGLTRWVDTEAELDTVTALSGSGPAYFFLFMEALEAAAIAEGLDQETARLLTIQTALGAARMAVESDESPRQLRQRVTSPGGTTERAIAAFEESGLPGLTLRAVAAARRRARELSDLIGDEQ